MSDSTIDLSDSTEYGERIVEDILRGMMHNFKFDLSDPIPYINRMDEYSHSDEFKNRVWTVSKDPNAIDIMIMYYEYDHVNPDMFALDHPESQGYDESLQLLKRYHMLPEDL